MPYKFLEPALFPSHVEAGQPRDHVTMTKLDLKLELWHNEITTVVAVTAHKLVLHCVPIIRYRCTLSRQ